VLDFFPVLYKIRTIPCWTEGFIFHQVNDIVIIYLSHTCFFPFWKHK